MDDIFLRTVHDILERADGPMHFRLVVQPIIASLLAARSGVRDAREDRGPFLTSIVMDRGQRKYFLAHGWQDIGKVFFMAGILDVAFQLIVFKTIHILETLVIAVTLSIVPYLLVRGPANRLFRLVRKNKTE